MAAAFSREGSPAGQRLKRLDERFGFPNRCRCARLVTMNRQINTLCAIAIAIASATSAGEASAQAGSDPNCTYERCALGLVPAWNGLTITRGESERVVGNLGFFMPGDVTSLFEGDPAALDAATDAVTVRRVGAVLTDAGIVLLATGLARAAFHRDFDTFSKALMLTGGLSLAASVPVQFAADGLLSRAVWLYNRRYAR